MGHLNETNFNNKSEIVLPISDDLKIKLEKLMWQRRAALGIVISKWRINQESKDLMSQIDSIISLTESYVEESIK